MVPHGLAAGQVGDPPHPLTPSACNTKIELPLLRRGTAFLPRVPELHKLTSSQGPANSSHPGGDCMNTANQFTESRGPKLPLRWGSNVAFAGWQRPEVFIADAITLRRRAETGHPADGEGSMRTRLHDPPRRS